MPTRILLTVVLGLLLAGCPPPRGVYHPVQKGQTLYRIGKAYGVDEQRIAQLNDISDPSRIKVGQRIFIPGADRPLAVPATASSRARPASSNSPPTSVKPPRITSAPKAPATPARTKAPAVARGAFAWPLKGKVVKGFDAKGSTPHKGVEISARKGAPVHSAAAGKVIYSGNGISGYGNLIILKHDDSFYTVYGYNQKNLVREGAFVSKEQKIALCGLPPGGGTARLHFEIRRGKQPVNPIFYLP